MARPLKNGLDYFPFDVSLYEDEKLIDVQLKYGPLGESIYTRLLCLIYKNGYYYRFEDLDKLASLLIRSVGTRWIRNKQTVIEVIEFLAKCNLFSPELMQRGVLTSRGIQLRYQAATERRQSNISEYNLLEKNDFQEVARSIPKNKMNVAETRVNVAETQVFAGNNAQSKGKESKGKESKVNSLSRSDASASENAAFAAFPPSWETVQAFAEKNQIAESVAQKFYAYYQKTGWQTKNGAPVQNWQNTLCYWAQKEKALPQKAREQVPKSDNAEAYRSFIYNIDE